MFVLLWERCKNRKKSTNVVALSEPASTPQQGWQRGRTSHKYTSAYLPPNLSTLYWSRTQRQHVDLGLDVLFLLPMQLQLKTTLIWWPYPGPCSWKWIRWPWVESALVHIVKRSSSPVPWPYHAPTWYDGRIDAGKKLWLDLLLRLWKWVWRGYLWHFF